VGAELSIPMFRFRHCEEMHKKHFGKTKDKWENELKEYGLDKITETRLYTCIIKMAKEFSSKKLLITIDSNTFRES
jgi:hypothetical protein